MTKYENINIVSFDENMRIFTSWLQVVRDSNGGERLKANSSNDYREVVTRKLAVQNHVAKAKNLCLTLWQDTREAVRARLNKEPTGAMGYNCSTKKMANKGNSGGKSRNSSSSGKSGSSNPNYPSTTKNPSGGGRGNTPKK